MGNVILKVNVEGLEQSSISAVNQFIENIKLLSAVSREKVVKDAIAAAKRTKKLERFVEGKQ